jgi:hypothetical protein
MRLRSRANVRLVLLCFDLLTLAGDDPGRVLGILTVDPIAREVLERVAGSARF